VLFTIRNRLLFTIPNLTYWAQVKEPIENAQADMESRYASLNIQGKYFYSILKKNLNLTGRGRS